MTTHSSENLPAVNGSWIQGTEVQVFNKYESISQMDQLPVQVWIRKTIFKERSSTSKNYIQVRLIFIKNEDKQIPAIIILHNRRNLRKYFYTLWNSLNFVKIKTA